MLKRTWERKIRSGVGRVGRERLGGKGERRTRRDEVIGRGRPLEGVGMLRPVIDLDLMDVSDDVA